MSVGQVDPLTAAARRSPPLRDAWEEHRDPEGRLRPAWAALAATLRGLDASELDARRRRIAEQILQDGVTQNVFDRRGPAMRPWSLELLPLLIEPADWARLEAGVLERVALMEAMLQDMAGPQRLLHEGLIPAAWLLRHPGFLRPLERCRPAGGLHLHLVAFDLARDADGSWWLLAQRTAAPAGLGYVLHNRRVIGAQFGPVLGELGVREVEGAAGDMLTALRGAAAELAGGDSPNLVLLSPGPHSETAYEHAQLARHLGLTLVEGGDLAVRDARLYLKSIDGLRRVHGVLRRLDDDYCDPLELRWDSQLGVPGLLEAVREQQVVMANALGTGWLESPTLQAFMPRVAERWLGRALRLPAPPTWWCGLPSGRALLTAQEPPDRLLRRSYPHRGRVSEVLHWETAQVDVDPAAFTLQQRLDLARTPIWADGGLLERRAVLRVHVLADGQGGWRVLPGGMTRVGAADRAGASVSLQRGGSSIDTWVLGGGPTPGASIRPRRRSMAPAPSVSSRVAENLFWMGRYTERAEQEVQLARTMLTLARADAPVRAALTSLARLHGLVPWMAQAFDPTGGPFEQALRAGLGDRDGSLGGASVAFTLRALERTVLAVRERLSAESWVIAHAMAENFESTLSAAPGNAASPRARRAVRALGELAVQLAAFTGAQLDRMTRDQGWHLLNAGRKLERLIGMGARLQAFGSHGAAHTPAGMDLLLELFDSSITFRSRWQPGDGWPALTELLVLDAANPRALASALGQLQAMIGNLPGDAAEHAALRGALPQPAALRERLAAPLRAALADPHADHALAAEVGRVAAELQGHARDVGERMSHRYFTLASPTLLLPRS